MILFEAGVSRLGALIDVYEYGMNRTGLFPDSWC